MTYILSIPQPDDIPAQNQPDFLTNFQTVNNTFAVDHIPFGNPISAATSANPCRITSTNHLLATGDTVEIYGLNGLSGTIVIPWSVNGSSSTVTVVDANTFDLDTVDASGENAYIANSGGFNVTATADPALPYPYGYHKKVTFQNFLNIYPDGTPNLASPISSLFTLFFEKMVAGKETESVELFFQNTSTDQLVKQITNHTTTYTPVIATTPVGGFVNLYSILTPWGLTINMGFLSTLVNANTAVQFPAAFRYAAGTHYTTIITMQPFSISGNFRSVSLADDGFTYRFTGTLINNAVATGYFFSIGQSV